MRIAMFDDIFFFYYLDFIILLLVELCSSMKLFHLKLEM